MTISAMTLAQTLSYAFSAANGARSLLKEWSKKQPTPEEIRTLNEALNDLIGQIGDATGKVAVLTEENTTLRAQIAMLQKGADLDSRRELRDGVYYLADPPAGHGAGPYCPACWHETHVPLTAQAKHDDHAFRCPRCKAQFVAQTPVRSAPAVGHLGRRYMF